MIPTARIRPALVHLGVVLFFLVLTVAMTAPLAGHLSTRVPGWAGDNIMYVGMLDWFARAFELHVNPIFNPLAYFPLGFEYTSTDMSWANTILAVPITATWGPVVAYNVMLLASFFLSGWATHLWVWRLTGSHAAGLVAGTIFAFSPYRMAHFPGHLNLMATQWLPFLLFAIEELRRRPNLGWSALAGLFFALNAWATWYYFYTSLIIVPIYLLVRLDGWRSRLKSPLFWRSALVGLAVSAVLIAPAAWPFLERHQRGGMVHPFGSMEHFSANPTDFFVPNLLHPLWGRALRALVPFQSSIGVEKSLYLGLVPLLLGLFAVCQRRRERAVQALAVTAALSFLLALGPSLHWAGQRVHLTIPPGAMALLYHLGITPYLTAHLDPYLLADMQLQHYIFIPLPMLLLYLFVPFTTSMRAIARFGMVTMLAVAALAGFGIAALDRRWSTNRWRVAIPALAIVVILFEFLALPYRMTVLQPRKVDLWLREQPVGAVVELPLAERPDLFQEYYATIHRQPTILGPSELAFPPAELGVRMARLAAFPDASSMDALREYETAYLLVHTDRLPDGSQQVQEWLATGELVGVHCFDQLCVYRLEARR